MTKEIPTNKLFEVGNARDHLDNTPAEYCEAISRFTPEEIKEYNQKLKPIKDNLTNPENIVSVGVGGGIEVYVLSKFFPTQKTKVIGLDLSNNALQIAKKNLLEHDTEPILLQSSAVNMALKDNSVDGVVFSSIMHEIYSYTENGKESWEKAICEAARILKPGGVLLLRDFAAPDIRGDIQLNLLTTEAKNFYNYFRNKFRTFEFWNEEVVKKMEDKRTNLNDFPEIPKNNPAITIPFEMAAEMILHFNSHKKATEEKTTEPFAPGWKEIDERYLMPDPDNYKFQIMSPDDHVKKIINLVNETLKSQNQELLCITNNISRRTQVAQSLKTHFGLKMDGLANSDELYNQIPNKMELVFKKNNKN